VTSASDGLVPWAGRAIQVRPGHLIQGKRATKNDVWEVLETKNPEQIQTNYGLWWRVVNLATGEERAIPPKQVSERVTFMVPADDLAECERSGAPPWQPREWPADAEQVNLLVEQLGATLLAQQDSDTGEIWCPNYADGSRHTEEWSPGVLQRDILEHLRIAHGMDTSGLEAITDWEEQMHKTNQTHWGQHGIKQTPSTGGFPHRHVPEDHSIL
jgi:hypothetical protein